MLAGALPSCPRVAPFGQPVSDDSTIFVPSLLEFFSTHMKRVRTCLGTARGPCVRRHATAVGFIVAYLNFADERAVLMADPKQSDLTPVHKRSGQHTEAARASKHTSGCREKLGLAALLTTCSVAPSSS